MDTEPQVMVTAAEALKRLGAEAPPRSTFYKAIRDRKIETKATPQGQADGGAMVAWHSVLEWNAARPKRGGPKPAAANPAGGATAQKNTGAAQAGQSPIPTAAPAPSKEPGQQPAASPGGQVSPRRRDRGRGSVGRKAGRHGVSGTKATAPVSGRRGPQLRKIKNQLRCLGFEEALDLRSWIDRRLLYVLRPRADNAAQETAGQGKP